MTDDQHKPTDTAEATAKTVTEDGLDVPDTEADNMAEDAETAFPAWTAWTRACSGRCRR